MRPFTATVRCLALASLGFGTLPAFAQPAIYATTEVRKMARNGAGSEGVDVLGP
jgi:hypothetical protein